MEFQNLDICVETILLPWGRMRIVSLKIQRILKKILFFTFFYISFDARAMHVKKHCKKIFIVDSIIIWS